MPILSVLVLSVGRLRRCCLVGALFAISCGADVVPVTETSGQPPELVSSGFDPPNGAFPVGEVLISINDCNVTPYSFHTTLDALDLPPAAIPRVGLISGARRTTRTSTWTFRRDATRSRCGRARTSIPDPTGTSSIVR